MEKQYSCELDRSFCEALDKMTNEERQRFIDNISKLSYEIQSYLKRQKPLPNLKFD